MDLFRNRPLALGCAVFLVALLISYFLPPWFSVLLISLSIVMYVSFIIAYKVSNNKRILKLLIKISASVLLLVICGTTALVSFKRNERLADEYVGEQREIVTVIDEEIYTSEYKCLYITKIKSDNTKIILQTEGKFLSIGDEIKITEDIEKLSSEGLGYNEADLYRDDGIFLCMIADSETEIEILSKDNYTLKHHLRKLNKYLDNIVYETLNEETAGLVSAMLLGNREGLSNSCERDFARLGISHVLSLSGMHLALIAAMLSAFLGVLRIDKRVKYAIMIIAVAFFVMLTGFAESAIRSALMVIIFYTLYYFGVKGDSISALFLSVTIICIVRPYLIFSISLILSFFAMLACLCSSYLVRKMRKIHRIKPKFLRNSAYVLITSIIVMLFTLPIVFLNFKSVALLSPIANIIIVPFLTLLLYLSPFVLALGRIPYLNTVIKFLCEKLTRGIFLVTENTAKIPNIVVSFSNKAQLISVIIITIGALLFLILSFEKIKYSIYSITCGILVFFVATIAMLIIRGNEVSISACQYKSNDIIAVESNNKLMIIECSNGHQNVSSQACFYENHLGYNEIDTYLFADYSDNLLYSVDALTDRTIVRTILLPEPQLELEESYYSKIEAICNGKGIGLSTFKDEIIFEDSKIYSMPRENMGYKNAVAFRICANNSACTYAPSNSRAVPSYFIEDSIEISDVVIFGSYGTKYNTYYNYKASELDYVVFLGRSKDYCKMQIKNEQVKPQMHRFVFK